MRTGLTEYEYYERKAQSTYNRRCIDGIITGCGNCVGYCKYSEHPGFLTRKLREQHDCINKGCRYYIQKAKRDAPKAVKDPRPETLLQLAKIYVQGEDDIRVLNSRQEGGVWIIGYISVFGNQNLKSIESRMEQQAGCAIRFQRLDYSFERCVELLCSNA